MSSLEPLVIPDGFTHLNNRLDFDKKSDSIDIGNNDWAGIRNSTNGNNHRAF